MDWDSKIANMQGWKFGNTDEMADEIAQETVDGKNKATCSLFNNDTAPKAGEQSYIKNSKDQPVCVIEIDNVVVKPFKDVGQDFAKAEGFRSLEEWKTLHTDFFRSQKEDFSEADLVVCEYFRVVHMF